MKTLRELGISLLGLLALAGIASAQKWHPLNHQPSFPVGAIALLTDGTVLLHEEQDSTPQKWYKLTPDINGSYINGTIKPIASLPVINGTQYGPFYFSSVVLPDGRFVIEGGEYNLGSAVWTNMGAIYDPDKDKWTALSPPAGWNNIGDAQAILLADGTYTQADCCEGVNQAYFNPKTLTWTNLTNTGKTDRFDEEGWGLLPNGDILTVDAINAPQSEVFNPATKKWTNAGSTIVRLEDPSSQEVGPFVLRSDGTVFAAGASPSGVPGHTAIYNTKTKKWKAGPDFPKVNGVALACDDAPSALERNGKVIVMTSPPVFNTGAVFFEWDGTKLTKIAGPPNAGIDGAFYGHFLELPTGHLLFSDFSTDVEVFFPSSDANRAWAPTITSVPATVTPGKTYVVKGTQFSGLSNGAAYGDDFQDSTNYALVRIINIATKHVFYAKTTNPSSFAVQTGTMVETTNFTVPAGIETGASALQVVTNGIASDSSPVIVD
jgi:hypothetical protein